MARLDELHATDKTWIVVVYNIDSRTPHYHGPFPTEADAKAYAAAVPTKDEETNRLIRYVGHTDLVVNTEWLIQSHAHIKD